jgi:disulfide bond formation protein DsbB
VTETVQTALAVLAVVGIALLAVVVVAGVARLLGVRWLDRIAAALDGVELGAAWLVALIATGGSLYFSEVANYIPCELCWYQRIAMYPLAVILGIAAFRSDRRIAPYGLALALPGAVIALYHYQLEWFPEQATLCTQGIPCSTIWFKELGFVTIPVLALIAFLLIAAALAIAWWNERRGAAAADDEPA